MKKLIICLAIIVLPLSATEIGLGMVSGVVGDSLILVDGVKVYVPGIAMGNYITENNQTTDAASITFPFTASLITQEELPGYKRTMVKIHKFYDVVDGKLVERKSY